MHIFSSSDLPSDFYARLVYGKQHVSENAKRSILCWLRVNGWARHEDGIRLLSDSDDDDGEEDGGNSDGCEHKEKTACE